MKRIALLLLGLTFVAVIAMRRADVPSARAARPAPRSTAGGTPAVGERDARPPGIIDVAPEARIARPRRNLFAYELTPPPPVPAVVVAPAPPVIATLAVAQPQPQAPKPPTFPYRYIGRFGPAHDPIAAFVGDGKIVTVRPGDRIDDVFVLRRIGLESVEIEARGRGPAHPDRVFY